ncbi:hypothetical protein PV327_010012 [Microctonus hyperodae]|uniref:RING-type domain-containing protein n=1 Tax=Microctonus hyperodae TaxID=165561 RepID=A0AA39F260_MICHY|nr:hypothetical protein PV327_010012 [Microctonus hyperodae]
MDIRDNNPSASTIEHRNNRSSKNNDKEPCTSSRQLVTNDNIARKNIDLPSSNSEKSLKSKKKLEVNAKSKTTNSAYSINSSQGRWEATDNELRAKNIQLIDMKMRMLRLSLESQFMSTNICIQNRILSYSYQYNVIEKIQNTLMHTLGTQLPLDIRNWLGIIEELKRINTIFVQTYREKLAEISYEEYCRDIDDVHLYMPNLPTLPDHNILELLEDAFHMYNTHFQRSFETSKPIHDSYPTPHNYDPPPYQNYPQYHHFIPQEQSRDPPIPPLMPYYSPIRTRLPSQRVTEPRSYDEQANYRLERFNKMNTWQQGDVAAGFDDRDELFGLLRSRNNNVCEYDLEWGVNQVRKKYYGSLSDLPLSVIIDETEQLLYCRGNSQIAHYSGNSMRNVSRNSPNRQPQRENSVPSTSSHLPTNAINKTSKSKKKSWNTIKDKSATLNKSDVEEECVICFEVLRPAIKTSNPTYTLQCKHIFHKKCINTWFKENQSCPTCRKHSVLDHDYPPL